MRRHFISSLAKLAETDQRIVVLTADLGFAVMDPFRERHSGRFFNVGVSEQNMVGVATGMAASGFIPFTYSMSTFATMRPFEFIRNGPVFHTLPVRLMGVGGGFDYGSAGFTHHAVEDVGLLRTQPGIRIYTPCDYKQAAACLAKTWELPGPCYYRLGNDELAEVAGLEGRFDEDGIHVVREGSDVLLVGMGPAVLEALRAAELLAEDGVACCVAALSRVAPGPGEALLACLRAFDCCVVAEAHSINGGAGSLVAEVVAEASLGCRVLRCGVSRPLGCESGSPSHMLGLHGISAAALARAVSATLGEDPRPGRGRSS